ncbi:MAG: DnaA/Hda family protein [Rhodospirillaceae bacterium]
MAQSGGEEVRPENILLALDTVVGDEKIKSCFVDDANLADQEALLHLYNCLVSRGGTLALASPEPPAYWEEGLPDLISRLNSLPIVEIRMPNDELLRGLLIKMFADRQVNVSAELVGFISSRMDRSYQAAREVVKRLDAESLVRKQAITIPMVKDVFREWL